MALVLRSLFRAKNSLLLIKDAVMALRISFHAQSKLTCVYKFPNLPFKLQRQINQMVLLKVTARCQYTKTQPHKLCINMSEFDPYDLWIT